jgi:hypothetical protein
MVDVDSEIAVARTHRGTRTASAAACIMLCGSLLAACGATVHAANGSGPGAAASAADRVEQLRATAARARSGTYAATWTVQSSGKQTTVALAQSPPDVLLRLSSGGAYLRAGPRSTAYACTAAGCRAVATSSALLASLARFDGSGLAAFLAAYDTPDAVRRSGARITFSKTSYAGLPSTCVTVSGRSTSEACVASEGVVTYWFSPGTILYLARFSPAAPSDLFVPPARLPGTPTP